MGLSTNGDPAGLFSSLIPPIPGSTTAPTDAEAFNKSKELKLGAAPVDQELRTESDRILREQAMVDRDLTVPYDFHYARPSTVQGLIQPSESDMLPRPPSFKTIDVQREVEKVRDARKRMRLDPSISLSEDMSASQASSGRASRLPSICAYTLYDVGDGYAVDLCSIS